MRITCRRYTFATMYVRVAAAAAAAVLYVVAVLNYDSEYSGYEKKKSLNEEC